MPSKGGEKAFPKKPMAAFFLYKSERYNQFQQQHPDKKVSDLTKIISEAWNKEPQEVKEEYQRQYKDLKEKYNADRDAYIKEHGAPEAKKKKIKKEKAEKKPKKPKKEPKGKKPAKKDKAEPLDDHDPEPEQ